MAIAACNPHNYSNENLFLIKHNFYLRKKLRMQGIYVYIITENNMFATAIVLYYYYIILDHLVWSLRWLQTNTYETYACAT